MPQAAPITLAPAPLSVAAPPLTAPNAPTAVSLADGPGSDLTVTWATPPVDAAHSAAIGFNLRFSPVGAAGWTTVTGISSPYDLSNLAAGAAFDVQLQGVNAAGVSPWSATTTMATAVAAPNAPVIAGVTAPPDGTVTNLSVTWSAPATDSTHGAATGYNLRFSPAGAGTWTTVAAVSSPHILSGLTGAIAFDIEVQPTNTAPNPGPWSATVTASTWGIMVAPGDWVPATRQTHGAGVVPLGGANLIATAAPTAVTGAAMAWSSSASIVPATGLITAGADGEANGWGQWFNAPATAGTYYLWLLAQGAGGTEGALVTGPITVI
jgi:hypothetical protein